MKAIAGISRRGAATLVALLGAAPGAAAAAPDPFAGVAPRAAEPAAREGGFFGENFGLRRELMSEFAAAEGDRTYSRQSVGGEVLKKFSSETATRASVDLQLRLVRRDRFIAVPNDMEGMRREGWFLEYHNAYADLYNVLDPLLSDEQRGRQLGRFNLRAGRFYVPFGLNIQTDTHGTLLQLSNERNLGFERDWYAGAWGAAGESANYDAYYLAGSGYYPEWRGQSGLAALRLSLAGRHLYEHGLEGGVSGLTGERLHEGMVRPTRRAGLDARWRRGAGPGLLTGTAEWSAGRDEADVLTQLYQADWLHASRRWGLAAQYRRFWEGGRGAEAALIGELSWYLRNDVANADLHWFKLALERGVEPATRHRDLAVVLQYYRYW